MSSTPPPFVPDVADRRVFAKGGRHVDRPLARPALARATPQPGPGAAESSQSRRPRCPPLALQNAARVPARSGPSVASRSAGTGTQVRLSELAAPQGARPSAAAL